MRRERERVIERKIATLVRGGDGFFLKWVCPSWRGVPDRIFFPGHGRVYFFELKREGEDLRPTQRAFHFVLARLGFIVHVVRSKEEFIQWVKSEGLPIYKTWLSRGLVKPDEG